MSETLEERRARQMAIFRECAARFAAVGAQMREVRERMDEAARLVGDLAALLPPRESIATPVENP